jgi:hypothetical protein
MQRSMQVRDTQHSMQVRDTQNSMHHHESCRPPPACLQATGSHLQLVYDILGTYTCSACVAAALHELHSAAQQHTAVKTANHLQVAQRRSGTQVCRQ